MVPVGWRPGQEGLGPVWSQIGRAGVLTHRAKQLRPPMTRHREGCLVESDSHR